ncbi:hypothetical protein ACTGJ9_015930 [Bradyrhizobium sp. RDM12]
MIRFIVAAALAFAGADLAAAQTTLRVGDQKGNSQAAATWGKLMNIPTAMPQKPFGLLSRAITRLSSIREPARSHSNSVGFLETSFCISH